MSFKFTGLHFACRGTHELGQLCDCYVLPADIADRANVLLAEHVAGLEEVKLGWNSCQDGEHACWYPTDPNKRFYRASLGRPNAKLWGVEKIGEEK